MDQELLQRGVVEIIGKEDLIGDLSAGKKLRIKYGIDPTTEALHLGYAVALRKLLAFQKQGHTIIFLIGDFTGRIGDPTGELKARKLRRKEEVSQLAKGYLAKAGKILDLGKTEVRYNSKWYDKMNLDQYLRLKAHFTVSQLLEREMFQKRMKENQEIGSQEIDYPILQAYDSVVLKSDLALCGHDQLFNEMQARKIQPHFGQRPQAILTVPLLPGLDGKRKMSQSLGNYIAIDEPPEEMFGKIMSIPDQLLPCWFELCTDVDMDGVQKDFKAGKDLRGLKARLALEIVTIYHGRERALEAEEEFNRVFREKELPQKLKSLKLKDKSYRLDQLLVKTLLAPSLSEARRLIGQGGVKIDGEKVQVVGEIGLHEGMVIQVGKRRFMKIKI